MSANNPLSNLADAIKTLGSQYLGVMQQLSEEDAVALVAFTGLGQEARNREIRKLLRSRMTPAQLADERTLLTDGLVERLSNKAAAARIADRVVDAAVDAALNALFTVPLAML